MAAAETELPPVVGDGAKRKRRRGPVDLSTLPPEEAARRKSQRERQQLALRLQSEGKTYNPKRAKRKSHKPKRPVQVIVIPVFWKQKHSEQQLIFDLTEEIVSDLRKGGVSCDSDTTNELTPGQKYRNWEEKGIWLRVEIGPREASSRTAVLAQTGAAGEVAARSTHAVGPALVTAVVEKLREAGEELAPVASTAQPSQTKHQAKQEQGLSGGESTPAPTKPASATHTSGDALEDDWVADGEAEGKADEPSSKTQPNTKKRGKRATKVVTF